MRLRAEGLADALVAFGELSDELPERLMEDGVLLDGWLLALDEGGWLDTDLLRRRLSGDRSAGRPAYVASDMLWTGGDDWQRRPFSARRKRLEATLRDGDRCVVSHALHGEGTLLAELGALRTRPISARRLTRATSQGRPARPGLRIPWRPGTNRADPSLALIHASPSSTTSARAAVGEDHG